MKNKTLFNLIFILLLTFHNLFSQVIKNQDYSNLIIGYVYSRNNGLPIEKATIKTSSKNELRYFTTDINGKFEIPNTPQNKIDFFEISSLGFKKVLNKIITDTIYLENYTNQLNEVIINSKSKTKYKLSIIEKLNNFETNFSWENKAAVYIPKSNQNNCIKNLLFAISDYGGVKNLKYLPFKVNLYTVDSLGKPLKPVFEKDIISKKNDDNSLTKVDISKFKITIPDEGIFVVFIILEKKDYPVDFINSSFGIISAVPALKAYKYSKDYIRKSYLYRQCDYPEKCNIWLPQDLHYIMDVEY
ncbi:hypothetical protein IRZ71_20650 [Flavobacterium sp. ANB]|uniref:hypothetical protein n=1 Tax=unclassified Flavobacterium TaxID=196869 RepID=UPI0012BA012D|nr:MULTISPECIES: hypothetical protein [unclassified Flavobacterium]MBF4518772.1 hypothetical protein [Flavobacterium sp. ANB]MTD71515.1 hypothetical protein [Flavobacterium sp. LC2016-13]